jgi:hypothetical protein
MRSLLSAIEPREAGTAGIVHRGKETDAKLEFKEKLLYGNRTYEMKISLTLLRRKVSVKMKTAAGLARADAERVKSADTKSDSEDAFPER